MITRSVGLLLGVLLALITVADSSSASKGATRHHSEVARSGYVLQGRCSDIYMRATIARSSYQPGQTVNVLAVVMNRGKRPCVFGGAGGTSVQYIGPCGAFAMTVTNEHSVNIWPGRVSPSCPAATGVLLPPANRVIAKGAWPLTVGFSVYGPPAPPGQYRLLIGSSIAFAVKVTGHSEHNLG